MKEPIEVHIDKKDIKNFLSFIDSTDFTYKAPRLRTINNEITKFFVSLKNREVWWLDKRQENPLYPVYKYPEQEPELINIFKK